MKLKSLILLAFVAALSACSFDKNDSLTDPDEIANRQKLKNAYAAISGTYKGTVGTQVVELRMYSLEENDGSNSNGAPRKKPVLYGNYKRIDPVLSSFEFNSTYYQERNELILTNKATSLNKDDVHTIALSVQGDRLVGKATTLGGYQSNVDLALTSRESSGDNGSTEDNEYYDNLRRQYQALAGTYEGSIFKADGSVYLNVSVRLRVQNTTNPSNPKISIPTLVGKFHDKKENMGVDGEGNATGMSDLQLTAIYNVDTVPRRLTLNGIPIFGGASNPFRASLEGILLNGEYKGSYEEGPYSFTGPFVLKKTADAKEEPAPAN